MIFEPAPSPPPPPSRRCGFPPFYGDNDAQMFKKIKAGTYKFLAPYWDLISDDAKDFVAKLLLVDPRKRMTAAEALNHRWLGRTSHASTKNLFDKMAPPTTGAAVVDDELQQELAPDGAGGLREAMMNFNLDRKTVSACTPPRAPSERHPPPRAPSERHPPPRAPGAREARAQV